LQFIHVKIGRRPRLITPFYALKWAILPVKINDSAHLFKPQNSQPLELQRDAKTPFPCDKTPPSTARRFLSDSHEPKQKQKERESVFLVTKCQSLYYKLQLGRRKHTKCDFA
jgi:hypothetical protein